MLEDYDNDKSDRLENIFAKSNPDYKRLILSGCETINVPEVLLNYRHFTPYQQSDYNTIYALKPIENLVIHLATDGTYQFLACSLAGAQVFREQIMSHTTDENGPAYIIVDNKGIVLYKSTNTTLPKITACKASHLYKDVMSYIEIINGKIINTLRASQFIMRYKISQKQYYQLVDAITKVHVSSAPVELRNLTSFESLCCWIKYRPETNFYLKNSTGNLPSEPGRASCVGERLNFFPPLYNPHKQNFPVLLDNGSPL